MNKKRRKMNLLEIKGDNLLYVGRSLASEQRKKILNAVVDSDKPLTITEVQLKGQIPNYKNTHSNIQFLEKGNFLKVEMDKGKKYEGAKITTTQEIIMRSIFEPMEKDFVSIFLVFSVYWSQRKHDLLPEWYEFLSKLEKKKKKNR